MEFIAPLVEARTKAAPELAGQQNPGQIHTHIHHDGDKELTLRLRVCAGSYTRASYPLPSAGPTRRLVPATNNSEGPRVLSRSTRNPGGAQLIVCECREMD